VPASDPPCHETNPGCGPDQIRFREIGVLLDRSQRRPRYSAISPCAAVPKRYNVLAAPATRSSDQALVRQEALVVVDRLLSTGRWIARPGSERASPPCKRDRAPDDQTPVVPRRENTPRQSVDKVDTEPAAELGIPRRYGSV
jgi:hypothetical protein